MAKDTRSEYQYGWEEGYLAGQRAAFERAARIPETEVPCGRGDCYGIAAKIRALQPEAPPPEPVGELVSEIVNGWCEWFTDEAATVRGLAREYGMSPSAIRAIKAGRSWKKVSA